MFPDEIAELKNDLRKYIACYSRIGNTERKHLLVNMLTFQKCWTAIEVNEHLRLLEDELSAAAADGQITLEKLTDNVWLFEAGVLFQTLRELRSLHRRNQ
jgi:hypothetical protein